MPSSRQSPKTGARKRRTALFDAPEWADTVAIRVMLVGDAILKRLTAFLAKYGITPLQFNVLRILYVRERGGWVRRRLSS